MVPWVPSCYKRRNPSLLSFSSTLSLVNAGVADYVVPIREFAGCIQREVMNT